MATEQPAVPAQRTPASLVQQVLAIGLTGGIGSGKSTVADLFAAHGASIIDTDLIAHALTAPGGLAMPAINAAFGATFLTATGALDRVRMRSHVFADPAARKQLEAILHPLIRTETERAAQAAVAALSDTGMTTQAYLMFVVPLLVESGKWRDRVDRILVVDCAEATQTARVMQRNAMTEAQVRAIMASQATRADRLAAADDVIVNEGDAGALPAQVAHLDRQYRALACQPAAAGPALNEISSGCSARIRRST